MKKNKTLTSRIILIIVICILGIAAYSNTFNSPFHFDDESSIAENLNIKNLNNLRMIWGHWPTRFLTTLSLAFNYRMHGLDPLGYHILNLAIHLCAAILAFWFILLTFATPNMRDDAAARHANSFAFFVAALFVAHPIQTQAVTYIIQRSAGLAALFYLLALCLYIRSRIMQIEGKTNYGVYYAASIITALAGIYTKESIVTLPLAILLYEFCFLKGERGISWKKVLPFFIISLIVPFTVIFRISEHTPDIPARYYLLTQLRVMVTYIRLLLIPVNQNLDYDYPIIKTLLDPAAMASAALLAVILIFAIRSFRKYRMISFSIFWFFLALLPESSIMPIHDLIFEHRLYLAALGYGIFLTSAIYYAFKNRYAKTALLMLIILAYAVSTYKRNYIWQDTVVLSKDIAIKSPRKARAYLHLGNAYAKKKIYDKAIESFNRALELAPDYGDAYYNIGAAYYEKGDMENALPYLDSAIRINPKDSEAYYYRGLVLNSRKEHARAISDFKEAILIAPERVEPYRALADTYRAAGKDKEAAALYDKAISAHPYICELYIYAAIFYGNKGDHAKVLDLCSKAIRINPYSSEAYFNLGAAYGNMGYFKEAINSFRKAVAINPRLAAAHNALAIAYYNIKDYRLAKKHADKAVALGYPVCPSLLGSPE